MWVYVLLRGAEKRVRAERGACETANIEVRVVVLLLLVRAPRIDLASLSLLAN